MIKKILVSLDGSRLAEKALPYARTLAQKFDAELILVRVLQPMVIMSDYGHIPFYQSQVLQEEADAKVYLRSIQKKFSELGLTVHAEVLEGNPVAETIIDMARETEVDLIVMSTHGRSGLSQWVYGSVANKVLQRSPCPVFLVRAKTQA